MILRVPLELRDQIEHDRHFVDAHSGGGLVEHEYLRLERDHQRDLELALVAMRQRRRSAVAPMHERDALEHGVRARDQVGALHPWPKHVVVHAGSGLHREAHVLGDRKARKQIGELERAAEPGSCTRGRREPRDVPPVSRTSPALAANCPEIRLKLVVLPAPFGPTIAVSSPGRKTQLTASTATWPPKRMVSPRLSSEVMRPPRARCRTSP